MASFVESWRMGRLIDIWNREVGVGREDGCIDCREFKYIVSIR